MTSTMSLMTTEEDLLNGQWVDNVTALADPASTLTSSSADTQTLPLSLRMGLLIVLTVTVMCGVPFNLLVMITISKVKELRTRVNTLLFCLCATDVFNCSAVSLAFICDLLELTSGQGIVHWAVCTFIATGMLFTNTNTFMMLATMAILRKKSLMPGGVTKRFLHASILAALSCSLGLSVYYAVQKGVSVHVCMNPYGPIPQGKNFILFILMLPFIVCVGLTKHSYCMIVQITRHHLQAVYPYNNTPKPRIPSLLRPMMTMFITFCLCYFPIIIHAGFRRALGMSPTMTHAQLIVNAFNFLAHAISSTTFCYQSRKLRNAMFTIAASRHVTVNQGQGEIAPGQGHVAQIEMNPALASTTVEGMLPAQQLGALAYPATM